MPAGQVQMSEVPGSPRANDLEQCEALMAATTKHVLHALLTWPWFGSLVAAGGQVISA